MCDDVNNIMHITGDNSLVVLDDLSRQPSNLDSRLEEQGHVNLNIEDFDDQEKMIESVRDGIIAKSTQASYLSKNFKFLLWLFENHVDCLTPRGNGIIVSYKESMPNASYKALYSKFKDDFQKILRNAIDSPIIVTERILPRMFINYITKLKNETDSRRFLSKSSYGSLRASLYHLFRQHNQIGYSSAFNKELSNWYKGWFRYLVTNRPAVLMRNPRNDEEAILKVWNNDESKSPMSVALYKALCRWLLEYGTIDTIFAHNFLVLTWNLACRANNTANIRMMDILWSTHFDSFQIFFSHSKTDQTGDDSSYPRHIFSNPISPEICPVLSLAFYFSSCFGTDSVEENSFLFPGEKQQNRFGKILIKILKLHETELQKFGFQLKDIGSHSIRKGASSYLTSLPGGPPAAACCLRGGWTMGNVKDRYFKYVEAGDQFVGRCLVLLPMDSVLMGVSPPFWTLNCEDSVDDKWISDTCSMSFVAVYNIKKFSRLLRMCLASLLYHKSWIETNLKFHHVVREVAYALRNKDVLDKIQENTIMVTYPWNDKVNIFTGIPPHISLLQSVQEIRSDQLILIDTLVEKVKIALNDVGVGEGNVTQSKLREVLEVFSRDIMAKLDSIQNVPNVRGNEYAIFDEEAGVVLSEKEEKNVVYRPHCYGGMLHRVPSAWRIPRISLMDLWRNWWIGDKSREIPPLRFVDTKDIKHIDDLDIPDDDMYRRTGKYKNNRRPVSKSLSDMRYIMKYIISLVKQAGTFAEKITPRSVAEMFKSVSALLIVDVRDVQKHWTSCVRDLRLRGRKVDGHDEEDDAPEMDREEE